jgi:hypothetical protein
MAFDYYQHEAQIVNLSSATTYSYDIFVGGVDATPGLTDRLTTAPATGSGTVRFIAFGDSGIGSTAQQGLATLMTSDTFDIALHGGDVVYGASDTTGGGWYPQYHNWFFDIYEDWLRSHPVYPSIGNHDDRISRAQAYRDLFALPENGASAAFPDHAERYYSFDYGPVHFVVLDTELSFQSTTRRQEQLNWLASDLSSTNQPWRVAVFHRSPYSAGGEHGSDLAVRQAFGPIFQQHGVQLVISAHEHVYERTVPWREVTGGSQAVTYIVAGGGGARLYPAGRNIWTATSLSEYHYVRGTVSGCQLTLEVVGPGGTILDQYTLDKCAQDADSAPPTISITSPSANQTVSGDTLVQAQAGDDVRVEKVDFFIDGTLVGIDLLAPYRFSWNTRAATDGAHTIEARVYDIAGNRISSGTRSVIVSNSVPPSQGDIVLYASEATVKVGNWTVTADSSAAGGARLRNPNAGAARINTPLANPSHYFEMTFTAQAATAYRLWLRGKADSNYWGSDSVWVQFSSSVNASGAPVSRIGTTSAEMVNLEDCSGCGISGWGWQDNGYGTGVLGPVIYFQTSGVQTIRVQVREDGFSIDQIVLSPDTFLTASPGALKNDNTILPRS